MLNCMQLPPYEHLQNSNSYSILPISFQKKKKKKNGLYFGYLCVRVSIYHDNIRREET